MATWYECPRGVNDHVTYVELFHDGLLVGEEVERALAVVAAHAAAADAAKGELGD